MPQRSTPKPHDAPTAPTSEPGLPAPENKRFYPALDGLRAIAVLMVFWQHYYAEKYPALNWGWAGVDVFFVLSGFLITGILYDTQNTAHRVRNFYMRRTLRIFPLYYGVLVVALLTTPIFHWFWNRAWVLWFLYLGNYARFLLLHTPLMTMGAPIGVIEHLRAQPITPDSVTLLLGHFWSLCVEEQFYLVWPMVVFTVRKRTTLRTICLCSLPIVLAARIACVFLVPKAYLAQELLYRTTPFRLDALLLGGLAALMLRGPEGARLLRSARLLFPLAAAGFLCWEFVYRRIVGFFYHPYAARARAYHHRLYAGRSRLRLSDPVDPLARSPARSSAQPQAAASARGDQLRLLCLSRYVPARDHSCRSTTHGRPEVSA